MNYEDLLKYVEHELQWLRYYANSDTRKSLTVDSNIYEHLVSIGYTKRVIPLDRRCSPCTLTGSDIFNIDSMIAIGEGRDSEKNKWTPLEVFWVNYPDKKNWVLEKLNN